ncbi:hypothetical protein KCV01_g3140, partial [Aureobasidium melanogenum]
MTCRAQGALLHGAGESYGDPGPIRTGDLPLRRGTLYPAELRGPGREAYPTGPDEQKASPSRAASSRAPSAGQPPRAMPRDGSEARASRLLDLDGGDAIVVRDLQVGAIDTRGQQALLQAGAGDPLALGVIAPEGVAAEANGRESTFDVLERIADLRALMDGALEVAVRHETMTSPQAQAQMPHDTTAAILGMVGAVEHRHVLEVEGAQAVQAGDVHTVLVGVGSPLVKRINATPGTKEVLRRTGVEPVLAQRLLALLDPDAVQVGRNGHRAAHAAERAIASARGAQSVGELYGETDSAAMAGATGFGQVGEHVRTFGGERADDSALTTSIQGQGEIRAH